MTDIHAKVLKLNLIVSIGTEDRDKTIEEFEAQVVSILEDAGVAKQVVPGGGYYVLDGKVCLPKDYDPETQDFKPGATPPAWAGGPTPVYEAPKRDTPVGYSPTYRPAPKPKSQTTKSVETGMDAVAEALAKAKEDVA